MEKGLDPGAADSLNQVPTNLAAPPICEPYTKLDKIKF